MTSRTLKEIKQKIDEMVQGDEILYKRYSITMNRKSLMDFARWIIGHADKEE